MRFIHTSDWHLGRSLHSVGMIDAQAQFLDWLVDLVRAESVEAVVVSGDIYDRALPSPDTVELLSDAVTRLVDTGAQVVLASGNHDSAIRLGFAAGLLERAGLHIRSHVDGIGRPIRVGDAVIHPVPYLEPSLVTSALGVQQATHADVLRAALAHLPQVTLADPRQTVVMAHAFVAGSVTSASERDISVGGVSAVPAAIFQPFGYAALGHLHRPQWVSDQVRYSGSPWAMDFGEAGEAKSVSVVELRDGIPLVQVHETPVVRPMAVLRGLLDDLLTDRAHAWAEDAWCQVHLTDPLRPTGAWDRLRRRFPHLLDLRFDPQGVVIESIRYAARTRGGRSELEICLDFLTHVRGVSATDQERAALASALDATRIGAAQSADERGVARGVA